MLFRSPLPGGQGEDQTIGTDAEAVVTEQPCRLAGLVGQVAAAPVDEDEVIPQSLILAKRPCHSGDACGPDRMAAGPAPTPLPDLPLPLPP